ncbi:MAG: hypothetical protein ABW128_21290, partial [Rhizorhabdus sp.]
MPAPRRNDPLGVSDNPTAVTDQARLRHLTEEFKRRLGYVQRHFEMARVVLANDQEFNVSLAKL